MEVNIYGSIMHEVRFNQLGHIITFTPRNNEFQLQLSPKTLASKTPGLCGKYLSLENRSPFSGSFWGMAWGQSANEAGGGSTPWSTPHGCFSLLCSFSFRDLWRKQGQWIPAERWLRHHQYGETHRRLDCATAGTDMPAYPRGPLSCPQQLPLPDPPLSAVCRVPPSPRPHHLL